MSRACLRMICARPSPWRGAVRVIRRLKRVYQPEGQAAQSRDSEKASYDGRHDIALPGSTPESGSHAGRGPNSTIRIKPSPEARHRCPRFLTAPPSSGCGPRPEPRGRGHDAEAAGARPPARCDRRQAKGEGVIGRRSRIKVQTACGRGRDWPRSPSARGRPNRRTCTPAGRSRPVT